MKTSTSLTLIAAALVAVPALAQMPDKPMGWGQSQDRSDVAAKIKARFAALDADRDGAVTKAETGAMRDKRMADMRDQHFKAMDSNSDAMISRAEFDAGHAAGPPHHGSGMGHGKGHGRGEGKGRHHMGAGMEPMGPQSGSGRMFERADANKDGKVTEAEMLTSALTRFDAADSNQDGTLTPDERRAARQAMRAKRAERKPG